MNGRFLCQPTTGVQRYAQELILAIDRHLVEDQGIRDRFEFTVLTPQNARPLPALKHVSVKQVGTLTGQLWEQFELPYYCRHGILAGFCNSGPLFKYNQIVTLCDASVYRVPEAYSLPFRLWYKTLFTLIGRNAKQLLTISNFSRDELSICCEIQPEKFTVTYPGINHQNWANVQASDRSGDCYTADRPFVLAVSSMSPHKNFQALVEAISLLGDTDYDVFIAGGSNPSIFKNAELKFPNTVKLLGYVSDDKLQTLYSQAACFIYPSLYEGFGLPPLEAMSNGCPVIVAHAGSLPEVCDDAALYCDPKSPRDIADKIVLMMGDMALRTEFREKGLLRSRMFTWEKCAQETLAVIQQVLQI